MNIYWTAYAEFDTISTFDFLQPNKLELNFSKDPSKSFTICPAYQDQIRNTYELKFPNTYNILLDKNISSPDYDQKYFDEMVNIRSMDDKLFSYNLRYLFYTDQPLEISMTPAYLTVNEFTQNTTLVPGKFDIGQWFRPLDCSFIMNSNQLQLKKDDTFAYIKFHTDKKINLINFYRSQNIIRLQNDLFKTRLYKPHKIKPMNYFYQLYNKIKFKKIIDKEVKSNIIKN